ncbi:putative manganese transporter [Micromonospora sp. CPCC 206061]|uniref:putative manganese transporter n=1 Tax=Micromonospora sp. CPCC 206061 TaxID=3122410 RepID=UPI002FF322EA
MIDYLARPMADAFMQVGVYVAVLVVVFGWLRWRYGDRVTDALVRRPRFGPLVGALLGVSPGCGGAIILMPLYARGRVSYGTVIAALAATMGDSSWVVLAWDPGFALRIHALLFAVGLVTGYAVDALRVDPARPTALVPESPPAAPAGDRRPVMATAFWGLTTPAFLVSVPIVFQMLDPDRVSAVLRGVDPYLVLGVAGTLVAVVIFTAGRGRFADDTVESSHPRSVGEMLRHGAHEASFVTVWVAVAYVGWEVLTRTTGLDGSELPLVGVAGVVAGALVGLVPGCAVQIVFTGLYVSGAMPLPTLAANAVSQDGDALIPLATLRHRSAALATVVTTIPALLVGAALLLVGF